MISLERIVSCIGKGLCLLANPMESLDFKSILFNNIGRISAQVSLFKIVFRAVLSI